MHGQSENEARYIGVDIGGTKTSVCLGDATGAVLSKRKFPTQETYETVLFDIASAIEKIISFTDVRTIKAIGVSCGGPLDRDKGVILSPPNLPSWDHVPVTDILSHTFAIPAYLENDANACALAEWYWGNGRGFSHLLFLTFGTGLGAGLILNGKLYAGASSLAGEVGHVRIAEDGPFCYGKRGSWEGYCSGAGLSELYRQKKGISLSGKDICNAAKEGDPIAGEIVHISATYLGRGIAMLIDIFNPECIIIGSIFSRDEQLFRPGMERELAKEALEQSRGTCVITCAALGDSLGDKAALGVAIDRSKEQR